MFINHKLREEQLNSQGKSKHELCQMHRITERQLRRWIAGTAEPRVASKKKLADALEADVNALSPFDEPQNETTEQGRV
jgi:transcriptional regulator with XRE-family HTH domain